MATFAVLITLLLFIAGTIIGSFLSVVILRSIRSENWVSGRSHCDSCGAQLAWYDNVPLLSYFVLKGKCRSCKELIPPLHLMLELLTGFLFVWWYWGGFLFFQLTQTPLSLLQPLFWLAVGLLLLYLCIIDYAYLILPNKPVFALLFLALAYRTVLVFFGAMQLSDLLSSIVAAAVASTCFLMLWLITKGKGIGFGDVKFALPLGVLLGPQKTIVALFLAFVTGGIVGAVLLATGKGKYKTAVPFGPFLIFGTVLSLLFGEFLFNWYWALLV